MRQTVWDILETDFKDILEADLGEIPEIDNRIYIHETDGGRNPWNVPWETSLRLTVQDIFEAYCRRHPWDWRLKTSLKLTVGDIFETYCKTHPWKCLWETFLRQAVGDILETGCRKYLWSWHRGRYPWNCLWQTSLKQIVGDILETGSLTFCPEDRTDNMALEYNHKKRLTQINCRFLPITSKKDVNPCGIQWYICIHSNSKPPSGLQSSF